MCERKTCTCSDAFVLHLDCDPAPDGCMHHAFRTPDRSLRNEGTSVSDIVNKKRERLTFFVCLEGFSLQRDVVDGVIFVHFREKDWLLLLEERVEVGTCTTWKPVITLVVLNDQRVRADRTKVHPKKRGKREYSCNECNTLSRFRSISQYLLFALNCPLSLAGYQSYLPTRLPCVSPREICLSRIVPHRKESIWGEGKLGRRLAHTQAGGGGVFQIAKNKTGGK